MFSNSMCCSSSRFFRSCLWVLLGTGAVLGLEAVHHGAIAQTTVNAEILLEPSEAESYRVFISRAEANAAVKVQSLFDQDLLRTEVRLTVLGQRSAAIAPVLRLRVSRTEWTAYPDPEIWSTYYPESKNFLGFYEEPEPEEEADSEADIVPPANLGITNPATGNRYLLTGITTWSSAQSEAAAVGGHLVVINDAAEQAWLLETFGTDESDAIVNGQTQPSPVGFWIGLTDIAGEGNFAWINGDPVTYTNFAPTEPNNISPEGFEEDYVAIALGGNLGSAGQWTDQSQDRIQLRGIVEIPAEAPPVPQEVVPDSPSDTTAPAVSPEPMIDENPNVPEVPADTVNEAPEETNMNTRPTGGVQRRSIP